MSSENPSGAGNQQERLLKLGWIVGFVDGEGCFSISFVEQPQKRDRNGYKLGFQVSHEFVVTQGERSIASLRDLEGFFGVGQVLINRRNDNHKENLYRYAVRRRAHLLNTIVPFFERYTLRTSKREDFEKFVRCLRMIEAGQHLSKTGLIRIAKIAETMNRRKSRSRLIRILRDHTPNVHDSG